jgi:hypothetical protein
MLRSSTSLYVAAVSTKFLWAIRPLVGRWETSKQAHSSKDLPLNPAK